jgi:hypothetical protein
MNFGIGDLFWISAFPDGEQGNQTAAEELLPFL